MNFARLYHGWQSMQICSLFAHLAYSLKAGTASWRFRGIFCGTCRCIGDPNLELACNLVKFFGVELENSAPQVSSFHSDLEIDLLVLKRSMFHLRNYQLNINSTVSPWLALRTHCAAVNPDLMTVMTSIQLP